MMQDLHHNHGSRRLLRLTAGVVLPAFILLVQPFTAQSQPVLPGNATVDLDSRITLEVVERRQQGLEDSTDLDETFKAKALEFYQQAAQELDAEKDAADRLAQFTDLEQTAPFKLERVESQLTGVAGPLILPRIATSGSLERLIDTKTRELDGARKTAEESDAEPRRRAARRAEIPVLVASLRERLAQILQQLAATSDADEPDYLRLARHTQLLARRQSLQLEIAALEKELAAYAATSRLMSAERDLAIATVSRLEREIAQLRDALRQQQQAEADRKLREAQRLRASQSHAAVNALVENYARLTDESRQLAEQASTRQAELDAVTKRFEEWSKRFSRTKDRVKAGGMTNAIGLVLRKDLAELPDADGYRRDSKSAQSEIRATQLRLFELQDRRADLADLEARVQETLTSARGSRVPLDQAELKQAVRDVLRMERELLDSLNAQYDTHFNRLVSLDEKRKQVIGLIDEYTTYINERILWIRSSSVSGIADFGSLWKTASWFGNQARWRELGIALGADVRGNLGAYAGAVLALLLLLRLQQRYRKRLADAGEQVRSNRLEPLKTTIAAVLMTVIVSLPGPLLLWFVAWRLRLMAAGELAAALASGLSAAAATLLAVNLIRQICRSDGLGDAHFGWPAETLRTVRAAVRSLAFLLVPLSFVLWAVEATSSGAASNPLPRLLLCLGLLVIAVLAHRLLRPAGPILQAAAIRTPGGWLVRLSRPLHLLAVGIPLALLCASLAGYHYTALRLIEELALTAGLLLLLLVIGQVVLRWLYLTRLKIAQDQQQERLAASEEEPVPPTDAEASDVPAATEEVDISSVSEQTRQILRAAMITAVVIGLWCIWSDVLPALGIFREVTLWSTSDMISQTVPNSDGSTRIETIERVQPVTLADFGLAVLVALLAIVALRNLPGLLEIAVLNRLPMDQGGRYALTTLTRWAIAFLGLLIAAGILGISWSKVQWLAAAFTIGLGFGLQEIFANFASGLVLLAERPIRVGDLVTVGDVHGRVTKIQMRATTIRDWKRKELLVPNKDLVTGKVVNWTLSDRVNRIDVPVGIAYGSDTELARKILKEIARDESYILDEPKPKAVFLGFGDSSLNLELRIFVATMDHWPVVITNVHTAIDKRFREAGIEIAFPQRDIHIRSIRAQLPVVRVETEDQEREPD